jgi:glutamate N-acetyltransferase / amino-acid N-acetyltransferase
VLMASGRAGTGDPNVVVDAVTEACSILAGKMLEDAEGASRICQVRVTGARSDGEAHRAAKAVADSLLVKCSINGGDPYWGRIASDLGTAGVEFDMDRLAIAYGGVTVCRDGVAATHDRAAVTAHMAGGMVDIHCILGLADGDGVALGVDLGYGYIDENRTTS